MRAKAGDPPRTMAQKILGGRCADPSLSGDVVVVKVDQVVLARAPARAMVEAVQAGLKRASVETAIAYETRCVTEPGVERGPSFGVGSTLAHGVLVARPGAGFAAAVHLERFASPARLCVTDEPRLAGVGGAGMLSIVVPPGQLGQALAQGTVHLRPPRSVQVLLSGRVRPFICARDVALELLRRGLGEIVRRVETSNHAPVILEFAGPSVRTLSVGERSVLAGLAPQVGAAGSLFASDERTEVFLRDQRRSKAHRALVPDPGAPCDEVINLDLGAVDPLILDEAGVVRSVRDLAGKAVTQVLLGGDNGVTLRDLFAAAALLKSKRVPPRLDLLVAVPSRQMLETLSSAGALSDLLAAGARLVEPDARVMEGTLYPPPRAVEGEGMSARTCDPEPLVAGAPPAPFVIASAETLSYAVSTGELGDPRSFKRPVRVTVPRALPTDDVLIVRERRAADAGSRKWSPPPAPRPSSPASIPWKAGSTLPWIEAPSLLKRAPTNGAPTVRAAVICRTLDEVRSIAARAAEAPGAVGAVVSAFIPSGLVALLSGLGIAVFGVEDVAELPASPGEPPFALPGPTELGARGETAAVIGTVPVTLTWLAVGVERAWAASGSAAPARESHRSARR